MGSLKTKQKFSRCGFNLETRKTKQGFTIIPIHYSMHPERDEEWVKEAESMYSSDAWMREMEIDFSKTEEKRVFKFFDGKIHGRKLRYSKEVPILRGWDFGYNTAACIFAQWNPNTDQLNLLGEVILRDSTIYEFKPAVVDYCQKRFSDAFYQDYCDIAGTFKNERAEKTSVEVLNDGNIGFAEIYPMSRKADVMRGLTLVRSLLGVRKDGKPGLLVDIEKCPILVRGFKGEYVLNDKDKPKVDQHPVDDPQDALRYVIENYLSSTYLRNKSEEEEDEEDLSEDSLAMGDKMSSISGYRR